MKTTLELKKQLQEAITTNHSGKMAFIWSISTSCRDNAQCKKNALIKDGVCAKCYAAALLEHRSSLDEKLHRNTALLTTEILPLEALPTIFNQYFRFEAFGDLMNAVQVVNYFNIAATNPLVKCALWTKNPQFIDEAIKIYGVKKPDNLNIVYSSLFLNNAVQNIRVKYPFIDKIFTVYTADYLKDNSDIKINCGGRSCANCLRCYEKNETVYINELLKQDSKKALKLGLNINED